MHGKIFPRQALHGAIALHIQVGCDGLIRQIVGGGVQVVILRQLFKPILANAVGRRSTIKNQLSQLQTPAWARPIIGWRILYIAAPLAARPSLCRHLRAPACLGDILVFERRHEVVLARIALRMRGDGSLNHLHQHRLRGYWWFGCFGRSWQNGLGQRTCRKRRQAERRNDLGKITHFHKAPFQAMAAHNQLNKSISNLCE